MGKPAPASASDLIPPIRAGIVDQIGEARPGTGARFIQPFVTVAGRRMLLDDATGGGFVLLAEPSRGPVEVIALDADGSEVQWELEGLGARVVQHELDHLDGVLIIDRTDNESRKKALAVLRPQPIVT